MEKSILITFVKKVNNNNNHISNWSVVYYLYY